MDYFQDAYAIFSISPFSFSLNHGYFGVPKKNVVPERLCQEPLIQANPRCVCSRPQYEAIYPDLS